MTGSEVDFDEVFLFVFFQNLYPGVKDFLGLVEPIRGKIEGHCIFVIGDVDVVFHHVELFEDSLFRGFDLGFSHSVSEGEVAESVDDLDQFFSGVFDFFLGVVFPDSEPDGVMPPVFLVRDGLEYV